MQEQVRFTALCIEVFGAAEASLEAGKTGGVKSETVGAVAGMIVQLSKNKGFWEWWRSMGHNLFADDFAKEVDRIAEQSQGAEDLPIVLPFRVPSNEN